MDTQSLLLKLIKLLTTRMISIFVMRLSSLVTLPHSIPDTLSLSLLPSAKGIVIRGDGLSLYTTGIVLWALSGQSQLKISGFTEYSTGESSAYVSIINGTSPTGMTDYDFVCATLDWWPPHKCDYGTCSWGSASLLDLVSSSYLSFSLLLAKKGMCGSTRLAPQERVHVSLNGQVIIALRYVAPTTFTILVQVLMITLLTKSSMIHRTLKGESQTFRSPQERGVTLLLIMKGMCTKEVWMIFSLINLDGNTTVQVFVSIESAVTKGTLNMTLQHENQTQRTRFVKTSQGQSKIDPITREEYHLTAEYENLNSQTMPVNGKLLTVNPPGIIPALEPLNVTVNSSDPITVAPFSIVSAHIPSVDVPACK